MACQGSPEQYLEDLLQDCAEHHAIKAALSSPFTGYQRISYLGLGSEKASDLSAVLARSQQDAATGTNAVCIVENVSPDWIGELAAAWSIERDFFLQHASSPCGSKLWDSVMGQEARENVWDMSRLSTSRRNSNASAFLGRNYCHIEGILQHVDWEEHRLAHSRIQRRWEHNQEHGWQVNTRISYYRVSSHLYLFLVDAPYVSDGLRDGTRPHISMRLPYTQNRSGLCIPQLYDRSSYSTFDILHNIMSSSSSLRGMFAGDGAIDYIMFSYFLAAILWINNLRYLDKSVKHIAFQDVRRPSVHINDLLHDRRRDLDHLRTEVLKTKAWLPSEAELYFEELHDKRAKSPKGILEGVYEEADILDHFLIDTFQILMSSISIMDAQTSIRETKHSLILTQLATIYVPLSFVTGVFGMNVKEINGSPISVWVCAIVLLVVGLCTAAVLWTTRHHQRVRHGKVMLESKQQPSTKKIKRGLRATILRGPAATGRGVEKV